MRLCRIRGCIEYEDGEKIANWIFGNARAMVFERIWWIDETDRDQFMILCVKSILVFRNTRFREFISVLTWDEGVEKVWKKNEGRVIKRRNRSRIFKNF